MIDQERLLFVVWGVSGVLLVMTLAVLVSSVVSR